jgi:hypothetical protein
MTPPAEGGDLHTASAENNGMTQNVRVIAATSPT